MGEGSRGAEKGQVPGGCERGPFPESLPCQARLLRLSAAPSTLQDTVFATHYALNQFNKHC